MLEGGLNFLDEGGGVLKIKILRLGGGALKKFNIWYLSPTNLRSLRKDIQKMFAQNIFVKRMLGI
jgi:hypothetical protein